MIIRELVLHNFGIYASTNKFEFHAKKPVVLIGGMNGRGKTTILEAVLLALYGSNSFAYMESHYKSYGQYLKSYVNRTDGTLRTSIDLEFLMEAENNEICRIHREWDGSKKRLSETIHVYKDKEYNQFLTDNWSMFIENILPSGLSAFFFFDGEKIAELAAENTSKQMKESIKTLLGISVLDLLENDLGRIISRTSRNKPKAVETKEIEELRQKRDTAKDSLKQIDEKIEGLEDERESVRQKLEKLKQEYEKKGGDIITQRQELFQKRSSIAARIENGKEQLINDAASELPLLLVKNYLVNIRENAEIAQDEKMMDAALKKMGRLFIDFDRQSDNSKGAREFIDYVRAQAEKKASTPSYNLSDSAIFKLQMLLDEQLLQTKLATEGRQRELVKLQEEAEQLDNYLSVDIDEKTITRIYKNMKELEQRIIQLDVEIDQLKEERRVCNGMVMSASSAFNKRVEEYLKHVELSDDSDRIIKYSHIATTIIDAYRIRLQSRKTSVVAKTMTECYHKLANKKELIDHIEMDPVTLDLKYIDQSGGEIEKSSLSAGEKQLMVISLLWSLALCSKKKLPVIIDTPLSRLDSAHRVSLIETYFPQAGEQTIILSTDSEIDRNYYDIMKENIGDEYTLLYDDETKATTVIEGYFMEEAK